jgi:hypothetical protein
MTIRHWSFYNESTGIISGQHFSATDDGSLSLNTPPGHKAIEGHHDPLSVRVNVETGELVEQPPRPSEHHEWKNRRWTLNNQEQMRLDNHASALAQIAHLETNIQPRAQRELLLAIARKLGLEEEATRLKVVDEGIASARAQLMHSNGDK